MKDYLKVIEKDAGVYKVFYPSFHYVEKTPAQEAWGKIKYNPWLWLSSPVRMYLAKMHVGLIDTIRSYASILDKITSAKLYSLATRLSESKEGTVIHEELPVYGKVTYTIIAPNADTIYSVHELVELLKTDASVPEGIANADLLYTVLLTTLTINKPPTNTTKE